MSKKQPKPVKVTAEGEHAIRVLACIKGCEGLPHPETIPELIEAVRRNLARPGLDTAMELRAALTDVMGEEVGDGVGAGSPRER